MKTPFLLLIFLLLGCGKSNPIVSNRPLTTPDSLSHQAFTQILQDYVDEEGKVAYKRLKAQPQALIHYLETLASTSPQNMSESQQLALYINAYNAYTLKLIIDHYPVKSILRITLLPIPGVSSAWDLKGVNIGGKIMSLQHLEHGILRKMNTPEIHAALVCAAKSCPKLRREAYEGSRVRTQLKDQMRLFLMDTMRNEFSSDRIKLSPIFKWFSEDFEAQSGSLSVYLAQFADGAFKQNLLENKLELDFKGYNWGLNDQE